MAITPLDHFETETPNLLSIKDLLLSDTKKHDTVLNINNYNTEEDDSKSDDAVNTESLSVQKSLDDFPSSNLLPKDNSRWSKGEGDRSAINGAHEITAFEFASPNYQSDENDETHGIMDSVVSDLNKSFDNYEDQNSCDKSLHGVSECSPEPNSNHSSTRMDKPPAEITANQYLTNTIPTADEAVRLNPNILPNMSHELIPSAVNNLQTKENCERKPVAHVNATNSPPNKVHKSFKNEIGTISVTSAVSLRQAIYQSWYQKRLSSARLKSGDNFRKEAEEMKKRNDEMNSRKGNQEAFQAWKQKKLAYFQEQVQKQKQKEENHQKKTEEIQERKKSSEKVFEAWRSEKELRLKKEQENLARKQREEQLKKKLEEEEKRTVSKEAYISWKKNKEVNLSEELQRKRRGGIEEEKAKQRENEARLEKAKEAYFQWELKKISSLENLNISSRKDSQTERFPWRPPSARPNPQKHFVIN